MLMSSQNRALLVLGTQFRGDLIHYNARFETQVVTPHNCHSQFNTHPICCTSAHFQAFTHIYLQARCLAFNFRCPIKAKGQLLHLEKILYRVCISHLQATYCNAARIAC